MIYNLRFFWKLVHTSLKQQTTYRAALAAGLATNLFFGLLRAALIQGLYNGTTSVNQMTLQDSWTFVGLTQAMIAALFVFGTTDLARSVTSGAVAADLLRPASYIVMWLGRDLGQALVNLVGRGVLFMLIYQFFFPIIMPASLETWAAFTLSLGLGWMVMFGWRFLANLAAFWTPEARGILRLAFMLSNFFSGFIMPLRLLPDWFSSLSYFTPFPSTINIPVDIYLGKVSGSGLIAALLSQAAWAITRGLGAKMIEIIRVHGLLHTPVRSLSLGQRMRADLCAALLHEPPLLFLDEPTIGLDVVAKERIRVFIQTLRDEGRTTILLTTHDLSDVEKLCERVLILDQGALLYDGSLDALVTRFEDKRTILATFEEDYADLRLPGLAPPVRLEGRQARYTFDAGQFATAELLQRLFERFKVADLEVRRPEIEDTGRRIYEERLLLPPGNIN